MAFTPVYYSQKDPAWADDKLGAGTTTLGYEGCAVTSVAMLLSGYGHPETPQSLNNWLKLNHGFSGALIRWEKAPHTRSVKKVPGTPMDSINEYLSRKQPVIVQVDYRPETTTLDSHFVLVYGRKGSDYLMLDPYPYRPGVDKEDFLLARYPKIIAAVFYEMAESGRHNPIPVPSSRENPPVRENSPVSTGSLARVIPDIGLNIRSSADSSRGDNIVERVPMGTMLTILDPGDLTKVGLPDQWVRVRTPRGTEGVAMAEYLERTVGSVQPMENTPDPLPILTPIHPRTKLRVRVQTNGVSIYESNRGRGKVISTETVGAQLMVVENAARAAVKIGKSGEWLNVKASTGKRGFIDAGSVKLV